VVIISASKMSVMVKALRVFIACLSVNTAGPYLRLYPYAFVGVNKLHVWLFEVNLF
jgi:hypothetical protein